MIQVPPVCCTVCQSTQHKHFITTKALMHQANEDEYIFHKCANCESVFLTNRVLESDLNKYYTDSYLPYKGAAAWGKFRSFVEDSQRKLDAKRVQVVAKETTKKKDFTLLDVGCGNPTFLALAQQNLRATCTGIDFSDEGWKEGSYKTLNLIQTSVAAFRPTQLFDVITLWHYLEHDYHLQETVDKLYHCLKPGGKLVIEVPDFNSMSAGLQKQNWQGWHSPRHITLFSPKGFRTLFAPHKWQITKHRRYGTLDAFTLWWLGYMESKQIDWNSSMEKRFWPLVLLKILSFPVFIFEKVFPMGIQLLVVKKMN